MKYEGTAIYDASNYYSVEADSLEQALVLLGDKVDMPSLCHQCTREVQVGDVVGMIVYCDGEEVADTRYEAEKLVELNAALAARDARIAAMQSLLERCGQAIAWHCFGDCRAFSEGPLPEPLEVVNEIRAALLDKKE